MTSDEIKPRVFQRDFRGQVQIGSVALSTLLHYRQSGPEDHESGGVLLGRYIIETDDIVIDCVTTPLPDDKSSRFHFFRARERHQNLIDTSWADSGGTMTYLGEWHTHPEAEPRPSLIDRAGWMRKLMFDDFTDAIFFVIVGTELTGVWEGRYRHPGQTKLNEVSDVVHNH